MKTIKDSLNLGDFVEINSTIYECVKANSKKHNCEGCDFFINKQCINYDIRCCDNANLILVFRY